MNKAMQSLLNTVTTLPREHQITLEGPIGEIIEANQRKKRVLGLVQEALQQLRVDMKYIMFDLHCTKKELKEAQAS